jgi:hypothetical protein
MLRSIISSIYAIFLESHCYDPLFAQFLNQNDIFSPIFCVKKSKIITLAPGLEGFPFLEDDVHLIEREDSLGGMKFYITAGVINRSRIVSFERMLWRISKGEEERGQFFKKKSLA